jgi:serine/threonine protein kinase
MKVIEDISMGLLFLAQEGVIHRDLKEFNVMIDRRKRGRLIDFGSVSSSMGVNRFKPVDDKSTYG